MARVNKSYPFRYMRPRQTVFIPGAHAQGKEAAAAYMLAKRRGWRFTVKTTEGGLRVRRVE